MAADRVVGCGYFAVRERRARRRPDTRPFRRDQIPRPGDSEVTGGHAARAESVDPRLQRNRIVRERNDGRSRAVVRTGCAVGAGARGRVGVGLSAHAFGDATDRAGWNVRRLEEVAARVHGCRERRKRHAHVIARAGRIDDGIHKQFRRRLEVLEFLPGHRARDIEHHRHVELRARVLRGRCDGE